MDRFSAMALFVSVAEQGSLSAASRVTGVPLASVSRKIGDLERHLGARLLVRTNRAVTLTAQGRNYLEACRTILDRVDEAERDAAGEYGTPRGALHVAAPIVFGRLHVIPVVVAFLGQFPEIRLRLSLADRMVHLNEEGIDVAVRIGHLPDSSLIAVNVGEITRVACASPQYLKLRGEPQMPADLCDSDCIAFEGAGMAQQWTFAKDGERHDVKLSPRLAVTTAEAAVDAAVAGLGITRVLSYQAADAIAQGRLVAVLSDYAPAPLPVSVVFSEQRLMPQKLRVFIDHAVPALREGIAGLAA